MKTKEITPIQYADYHGCTLQNITKQLRKGRPLAGVRDVIKYSRFYLLIVSESMEVNTIEDAIMNVRGRVRSMGRKKSKKIS
jgi:hypothetical protein